MAEALTTEIRVEGVEEAQRSLMEYFRAYQQGEEDVKELNKAMREQYGTIYGMRRSLSLLRTEWRMQHAAWVSGARVMRDIGRIGRTLTSMWQAYTLGMMRVESAQSDVARSTLDVADAQERYRRYLEVFGEESIYAKEAHDALTDALEAQKDAMERAKKAQSDMTTGLISFGLSAAGVGAEIITMVAHLKELAAISGIVKTTFGLAPTGLAAVGAAGVAVMVAQAAAEYPIVLEARRTVAETIGREEAIGRQAFAMEVAEVLETAERYTTGATAWRGRQFGGEIFETGLYYLHRGEEVIPKARAERLRETRAERLRERGVIVRHVTINQYIANVSSDVDIDRLSREAYRKLMRKLEVIR